MYKYVIIFLCCIFSGCNKNKEKNSLGEIRISYNCELRSTDKIYSFELNSFTRYFFFDSQFYKDKDGKEYFTFKNYQDNTILFYSFPKGDLEFEVSIPRQGPNAIPQVTGYQIEDFDNIYITSYAISGITVIDTTGIKKRMIPYGTTPEGYTIAESYYPSSYPARPFVFIENEIYLTQQPSRRPIPETPVSVKIDTLNHTYTALPFDFPTIVNEEKLKDYTLYELNFGRIYDNSNFIYSFYFDEFIYVTPPDHKNITKVRVKSKYIPEVKPEKRIQDIIRSDRRHLEQSRYGSLIYDPYREVYYRFAYPEVELDPNIQWARRSYFGRKKTSIIILDKEFNIIGETLLPEAKYNSTAYFVHPDGLYIGDGYQINYDQPEDIVSFVCFELVKK